MKAKNVTPASKRPSKPAPTTEAMIGYCVAAFNEYTAASTTLDNAKALFDAARLGLRTELARAHKVIGKGRAWDTFKNAVRAALVKARVFENAKDAGTCVNNQIIALGITGNGARSGGKKRGRKEKTTTGEGVTVTPEGVTLRLTSALAYIANAQETHAGDTEMLEMLGELAAILGGNV